VLGDAMRGQDAVIDQRGLSFKSKNLIAQSVPGILATMQAHGIKRLMFTSAAGVGETYQDSPLMAKIFFRTLLRGIYADKAIGDQMIRNSKLEWTIVHPVQLTDGPLTKKYRVAEHLPLSGMPQVSRADTAHFIVDRLGDPTRSARRDPRRDARQCVLGSHAETADGVAFEIELDQDHRFPATTNRRDGIDRHDAAPVFDAAVGVSCGFHARQKPTCACMQRSVHAIGFIAEDADPGG
jgi:hypothetical protein